MSSMLIRYGFSFYSGERIKFSVNNECFLIPIAFNLFTNDYCRIRLEILAMPQSSVTMQNTVEHPTRRRSCNMPEL